MGWYAPSAGTINCQACAAGYFSHPAQGACVACPTGFVAPTPGTGRCKQCKAGMYANAATAATECLLCPAGTFSLNGEPFLSRLRSGREGGVPPHVS